MKGATMTPDEEAIRALVQRWMDASKTGDTATVLSLMTDDVLFTVSGKEPFGKKAFAAGSKNMLGTRVEGTADIQELQILGDFAWMRNKLRVTITPPGRSMTFKPTLLAVEQDRLLRWRGRLGVPGLLDGQHEFHLKPLADGGTRFLQTETFTGVLVPLFSQTLDDTAIGFAQMNRALRNRAVTAPPLIRPTDP